MISCSHLNYGTAKGPDVDLSPISSLLDHFRGHPIETALDGLADLRFRRMDPLIFNVLLYLVPCSSKIRKFDILLPIEENIGSFQVCMYDVILVEEV